jgi:hypothetical protein
MGISTNKKGPSERANMKDKSDRATNEQVLDPRTRLILFKMIGRGLISEVNGCVSTGKEVIELFLSLFEIIEPRNITRLMFIMLSRPRGPTLHSRFLRLPFLYSKTEIGT